MNLIVPAASGSVALVLRSARTIQPFGAWAMSGMAVKSARVVTITMRFMAARLSPFRQCEHIQGVACSRHADLGDDRARHDTRAAAAGGAGGDGDVLPTAGGEGHRIAHHGRAEARLPQRLPGLDVKGAEGAIEIADEADAAVGRDH